MNNLKSVLSSFQFVEGNCVWAVRGQDRAMISSLLFSVGVTAMFPPTESVRSKDHRWRSIFRAMTSHSLSLSSQRSVGPLSNLNMTCYHLYQMIDLSSNAREWLWWARGSQCPSETWSVCCWLCSSSSTPATPATSSGRRTTSCHQDISRTSNWRTVRVRLIPETHRMVEKLKVFSGERGLEDSSSSPVQDGGLISYSLGS